MTQSQMQKASRPLAVALAIVFTGAFWLPTLSNPAEAAAREPMTVASPAATPATTIVVAVAPALM
ncbi:hypothetical protein EDF56_104339 [Novosphingobium sp. PhB165]|uniref:hypothetical protein n=1 Tax=Novosphingobium sp. PhB165 TaxID=2485105 RepID=UPI001045A9B4|nr:hypothetical protein [Novosphingobium sp. PhB165]TCM18805.1 hypothetical protein EDF56_104339 [Novosphingobium sp. PhB165]